MIIRGFIFTVKQNGLQQKQMNFTLNAGFPCIPLSSVERELVLNFERAAIFNGTVLEYDATVQIVTSSCIKQCWCFLVFALISLDIPKTVDTLLCVSLQNVNFLKKT